MPNGWRRQTAWRSSLSAKRTSALDTQRIRFKRLDNTLIQIDDFDQAQKLADDIRPRRLHRHLDQIARQYGPILRHFPNGCHWSLMQYDKHGRGLRIETVANEGAFFKHHRKVEHRDGTWEMKEAPLKKSIYSLPTLGTLMTAANRRYREFISTLDDPTWGIKDLNRISRAVSDDHHSYQSRKDVRLLPDPPETQGHG